MSVNHGGAAVIAASDIVLSPITIVDQPSTFEFTCARALSGQFSAVIVVVYRPGSAAIQREFYDELAAVLDHIATYQDPVYVTSDFNVRLDCPEHPHVEQLRLLSNRMGLCFIQLCQLINSAGYLTL